MTERKSKMKKIICEYINKKGDEICMIGDEDGDAFYKVNLDRFDVSDVPDILDFDTLLNDVRKEIYVSDDYADELLLFVMNFAIEYIEVNIDIYNFDEELLFSKGI